MKNFTREELAGWIMKLRQAAADDMVFNVSYFKGTRDCPICIVGGWSFGFSTEYSDLVCISESEPNKFMAISIIKKPESDSYSDKYKELDSLEPAGEDLRIALEWEDDPEAIACFYEMEWERLMRMQEV